MGTDTPDRAGIYGRQSKDKTKSITEQIAECTADAVEQGALVAATYRDGVSASRFTTKQRDDWARVLVDITAGKLDMLVLWESSRGDRDAQTWLGLLATCRRRRVLIRITSHERTYDMGIARDWKALADDGIDSQYESEKTSLRMKRAMAAQAKAGKPHGNNVYGYQRLYRIDEQGKRVLDKVVAHPEQAPIVADIVHRIGRGEPVLAVVRHLNDRGIPSPTGKAWRRNSVRDIALRVGYLGRRQHNGETHQAVWPPIVAEADHLAARRILTDPTRRSARPTRQKWLLSYLGRCAECGAHLHGVPPRPSRRGMAARYECEHGCASIQLDKLDELVTEVVCRRLAADTELRPVGNDAVALAARAEAEALQARLAQWRESARRGQTSPASLAHIEAGLLADVKAASRRAEQATTPAVLLDVLDGAAGRLAVISKRFAALPVTGRREIIALLLDVSISKATSMVRSADPIDTDRVHIGWRT